MARIICLLIIYASINLKADEISGQYFFWAKYYTANQSLSSSQISISKAMTKSDLRNFRKICFIKGAKKPNQSQMQYFNAHKNELQDCFIRSSAQVLEFSKFSIKSAKTRTNLTYTPLRFIAIFKPKGATILAQM